MKTINYLQILSIKAVLILFMVSFLGCEEAGLSEDNISMEETENEALELLPMEELSQGEIDGLMYMREEEKLARDVYLRLYETFAVENFTIISKSEQAHMDAIKFLLDRYGLEDPAYEVSIGIFRNDDLQNLHDKLMEMGSEGKIEALRVGALIEETDIIDIQNELDHVVDNRDITFVYNNLIRGSYSHLKSFVGVLGVIGVNYEPVLLDDELYKRIISE
ncbi:hypothetical protein ES705_13848 [subsurface metagenome]